VDEVLQAMSRQFDKLYAESGRPSIPPERLFRALLLQVFYFIPTDPLPGGTYALTSPYVEVSRALGAAF
jgi:hypothetical protein